MNTIIYSDDNFTVLDVSTPTFPGVITLIDTEDLPLVSKYHWGVDLKGIYYYISSNDKGHKIYLARIVMNCPEGKFVDHKNGDTVINCKCNLRICTKKENQRNVTSSN